MLVLCRSATSLPLKNKIMAYRSRQHTAGIKSRAMQNASTRGGLLCKMYDHVFDPVLVGRVTEHSSSSTEATLSMRTIWIVPLEMTAS